MSIQLTEWDERWGVKGSAEFTMSDCTLAVRPSMLVALFVIMFFQVLL